MTRASSTVILVEKSFATWRRDPDYRKAYDSLGDEFSLAAAKIEVALVYENESAREFNSSITR